MKLVIKNDKLRQMHVRACHWDDSTVSEHFVPAGTSMALEISVAPMDVPHIRIQEDGTVMISGAAPDEVEEVIEATNKNPKGVHVKYWEYEWDS